MNLSIIIPNYNGELLLQKNLPKVLDAVKDYTKGKIEIIIPNDPSTDNSHQIIQEFIKSIPYKNIVGKTIDNKNRKEAGFSKNVTRGVKLATGEILLLLNSDVSPYKGFLDSLLKHFEDEQVFAVGCMDESIEGKKKILRGRGVGRWQRGFMVHNAGKVNKTDTLWVNGGSGAFRKSIWDRLHGLDMLYNPFYWEDIDISYRALKSGYKTIFEPKSVVIHEHDLGAIKSKFKNAEIKKIAYRNQFIFVWKNITQTDLLVSHFCWLPYYVIKTLIARDWAFFSGFYLALMQLSKIRKSRSFAKKLFVRSDSDVLKAHSE